MFLTVPPCISYNLKSYYSGEESGGYSRDEQEGEEGSYYSGEQSGSVSGEEEESYYSNEDGEEEGSYYSNEEGEEEGLAQGHYRGHSGRFDCLQSLVLIGHGVLYLEFRYRRTTFHKRVMAVIFQSKP